jgi:DNA polymerase
MHAVLLAPDADAAAFRAAARRCVAAGLAPRDVAFVDPEGPALFPTLPPSGGDTAFGVPRAYADLLDAAACHANPDRFDLLYAVLWRILHGERALAENLADPAVGRLDGYARAVRRDTHKMHAFLRFRPQDVDGCTVYVAWFEPQHHVLRRAAPFFVDRFHDMDWSIATPRGVAIWRDKTLSFEPPVARPAFGDDAVLDEVWRAYFRATFDPARVSVAAMRRHMPQRYWRDMPETAAIPALVAEAGARVASMRAAYPMDPPRFAVRLAERMRTAAPEARVHEAGKAEIDACRRCPLFAPATQGVPGEGPTDAAVMLVGEQPGDQEDLAGRPFVGPAGQVLDRALGEAGLDRGRLYLTNAVKHFKFVPRGKRRLHEKPNAGEIAACRWWLDRELEIVKPRLVVALGATAAASLAGRAVSVTRERGPARFGAHDGYVTVHPSFLLRLPDVDAKRREYAAFVEDLRRVRTIGER